MYSSSWRKALGIISILVLVASLGWLVYEPGFEAFIAFLGALAGILTSIQRTSTTISEQREKRLRRSMIRKVDAIWIQGLLQNSLYGAARLQLGLKYDTDAVERPWPMVLNQQHTPPRELSPGTDILDVFRELGGSMLILGEPGSGKTTTLLQLARELLDIAGRDENEPIPVVLNLSSWALRRQSLEKWVIDELSTIYQASKKLSQEWLAGEPFRLLLDGLDEVKEAYRDACVKAINEFRQSHSLTDIIVCSRIADYDDLSVRLRMFGAVTIMPLSPSQIDAYLGAAGEQLAAARAAITTDVLLQELVQSPLTLSILALAYRGDSLSGLETGSLEERRRKLFATYARRMLEHRYSDGKYSRTQAIEWLTHLAVQMYRRNQAIFYIEHIHLDWLPTRKHQGRHNALALLVTILICGLVGGLSAWFVDYLLVGVLVGLLGGFIGWLLTEPAPYQLDLQLVELLKWLPVTRLLTLIRKLFTGLVIGCLFGLYFSFGLGLLLLPLLHLLLGRPVALFVSLGLVLLSTFAFAFVGSLTQILEYAELKSRTTPNQGVWDSARNAVRVGVGCGIISGLTAGVLGGPILGFFAGLLLALASGVFFGGNALIRHFILRFMLYRISNLPWQLSGFLEDMDRCVLLRKVGGGYIFVHRALLEYFVATEYDERQQRLPTDHPKVDITGVGSLTNAEGGSALAKSLLDLSMVASSLIIVFPLIALVAILIRLDSCGPIFHRRRVVGLNGREFAAIKFRCTHVDRDLMNSKLVDPLVKLERNYGLEVDSHVTRVGSVLRKLALDELPQLYNVLKQDMSLVGPRVVEPGQLVNYGEWRNMLLLVRPGLTGMWQVKARLSETTWDERVRLDMEYVLNWSFWLDWTILLQTIPAVLRQQ
jgi:lipopolysaccharide/colanic/teichoic acid biosynthesis glycosyltransferase/DNA polymerase III delta prime subunit